MMRKYRMLLLLLLPLAANAEGIGYSYAELNYIADQDFDLSGAGSDDGDGFNFNASFAIDDTFFVNGSYSDVGLDDSNIDVSTFNVGVGGRSPLSSTLDAYGVVSYEDVEVDIPGFGDVDDDGFGIAGGLRGLMSANFELNGQVKYTDIGDSDGWGFKLGALYGFAPNWAAGADYSSSELEDGGADLDIDELRVGVRYIF
ncbi:MAG TPA: outer membrane beta-barrel protein [Nevskiales bacterium]|nr:outer membrane beta-barrel protein [Nevskiales bacterium]